MADQSDAAMKYYEDARTKGRAITGRDLRRRFTMKEHQTGLTKQRKKMFPTKPGSDEDIMDAQSRMRKAFSK